MIVVLTIYQYFLYRVVANYISNKWLCGLYAILIISQVLLGGYVASGAVQISEGFSLVAITYSLQGISLTIIFAVIIVDMFTHNHDINYSLLAATNGYFLLPIIFSFILAFLCISNIYGHPLSSNRK